MLRLLPFALLLTLSVVACAGGARAPLVTAGAPTPLSERDGSDPFAWIEERTPIVAYEFGQCEQDADCAPRGCGGAMCSTDDEPAVCLHSPVSECLARVPASSCGCVEGVCRWARDANVLLCSIQDDPPAGNRGFRNDARNDEYPLRLTD